MDECYGDSHTPREHLDSSHLTPRFSGLSSGMVRGPTGSGRRSWRGLGSISRKILCTCGNPRPLGEYWICGSTGGSDADSLSGGLALRARNERSCFAQDDPAFR